MDPTGAFTVLQAGIYRVSYVLNTQQTGGPNARVLSRVLVNGFSQAGLVDSGATATGQSNALVAEDVLFLNVGDVVQLQVGSNAPGPFVTVDGSASNSLMLIALNVTAGATGPTGPTGPAAPTGP